MEWRTVRFGTERARVREHNGWCEVEGMDVAAERAAFYMTGIASPLVAFLASFAELIELGHGVEQLLDGYEAEPPSALKCGHDITQPLGLAAAICHPKHSVRLFDLTNRGSYDPIPKGVPVARSSYLHLASRWPENALRPLATFHTLIPDDAAAIIARNPSKGVRRAIAGNRSVPFRIVANLERDPELEVQGAIARRSDIPADMAGRLAGKDQYLAEVVAANAGAPEPLLREMFQESALHQHLANNHALPEDLMEKLARSRDKKVLEEIAYNPSLPVRLQIEMVEKARIADIHYRIARRGQLATEVVLVLLDHDPGLIADILRRSDVSEEIQKEVLAKGDAKARRALACYPSVAPTVLEKLLQDEDHNVKSDAWSNVTLQQALRSSGAAMAARLYAEHLQSRSLEVG